MPVVRGLGVGRGRARFVRVLAAREGGGNRLVSIDYLAHSIWKVYNVWGLWIALENILPIATLRG